MRIAIASLSVLVCCAAMSQMSCAAGKDSTVPAKGAAAAAKSTPAASTKSPAASAAVPSTNAKKGGSGSDVKAAMASMSSFDDKAAGVTISYPKSWKFEQPGGPHIVRFKHPDTSAAMSISLSSQDAFKNETLKEFVSQTNEKTVKYGKENDFKVTIVQSKPSGQLAQTPAIRTEMKYDLAAPAPQLKVSQLTALKGGRAYTLTYTSPSAAHEAYMPLFEEMVKSLKITAAPTALKDVPHRTAIPAQLGH
jgi:hypothetical protein